MKTVSCYRAKDDHNKKVKKVIEEEISANKENSYSQILVDSKYSKH